MTAESWFKTGGADAIADKLLSEGKTSPIMMTTSSEPFTRRGGGNRPEMKILTLRADDYKTWQERRDALVKLLMEAKE